MRQAGCLSGGEVTPLTGHSTHPVSEFIQHENKWWHCNTCSALNQSGLKNRTCKRKTVTYSWGKKKALNRFSVEDLHLHFMRTNDESINQGLPRGN